MADEAENFMDRQFMKAVMQWTWQSKGKMGVCCMDDQYRKIQFRTIILFTVLIVAVSLFLVILFNFRTSNILNTTALSLLTSENRQREKNTNQIMNRCELDVTYLYTAEYDPADGTEAERNALEDRINEAGVNADYRDFAIVFNDDSSIGRLSETTRELYDDESIYTGLSNLLKSRHDSWVSYMQGSKSRLYYLNRFNDNAIAVVSLDKSVFSSYYRKSKAIKGTSVSLVDEDGSVVYCSDSTLINTNFDETGFMAVQNILSGTENVNDTYYICNTCDNGMKVIVTVTSSDILAENRKAFIETLLIMAGMVIVVMIYGLHRVRAMNSSQDSLFGSLQEKAQHDQMTGLYTKTQFASNADTKMKERGPQNDYSRCTFTILDLDNFKSINDGYGHIAGDDVIREFSRLLNEIFDDKRYMVGRLGGDEFGVFGCFDIWDDETLIREVNGRLWNLRYRFRTSEVGKRLGIPVLSYSSGTVISKEDEKTFAELYKRADSLLYNGKKTGKGKDINELSEKEDHHV